MEKKKVTIKDVAKYAQVSPATVSQILNGQAKRFDPKTVARVRQAKEHLGYEANYLARKMVGKQSMMIGILVPDITNPFFNTLVKGIEEVLFKAGFIAILGNGGFDGAKEEQCLFEFAQHGVDGFIIASPSISDKALQTVLTAKKRPYLVLDQKAPDGQSDALLLDDRAGGRLAAEYLAKKGHKKVALVVPKVLPANLKRRMQGFLEYYPEALVLTTEFSKAGGKASVPKLLTTKVSAVFALNDELAFGIYRGLAEHGKKVGSDLSVMGYDNVEMCEYVTPALTTIKQPLTLLGKTAAKLILARLKEPTSAYQQVMLPVELIERASVIQNN